MAVKRRNIWLSDETWADLADFAKTRGVTASRAVGMALDELADWQADQAYTLPSERPPMIELTPAAFRTPEFRPVPKPSQKGK